MLNAPRRQPIALLALLLGLPGMFAPVHAEELAVIVHPSNPNTLTVQQLAQLFLGRTKHFPNGLPAHPINRDEGAPARALFDRRVAGKSPGQMKACWSEIVFTGKGSAPLALLTDEEVKSAVAADQRAIGYIDPAKVDSSVRVLLVLTP